VMLFGTVMLFGIDGILTLVGMDGTPGRMIPGPEGLDALFVELSGVVALVKVVGVAIADVVEVELLCELLVVGDPDPGTEGIGIVNAGTVILLGNEALGSEGTPGNAMPPGPEVAELPEFEELADEVGVAVTVLVELSVAGEVGTTVS